MRSSREMALAAVEKDGMALQFLPKEIQADREVALTATGQEGRALKYASKEVQADVENQARQVKSILQSITGHARQADAENQKLLEEVTGSICPPCGHSH